MMNGTRDTNQAPAAGDGDDLDPREAAALLARTTRQARRRLEPAPPWLLAVRGVLVLVACGVVWLSVRGQHPYQHPTVTAILVIVAFGFGNLAATVAIARRQTTGVRGKSRLRPAEITILAVIWIGVFVVMGALADAGVSAEIVYGWYPITVPLILAGVTWAGMMTVRSHWRAVGTAVAVTVVGIAGLLVGVLAGAAGAWAVVGVGLCATLLGTAAAIAWQQRG